MTTYAVIDTETTGIGSGSRVIQFAVVHLAADFTVEGRWSTLIDPGLPHIPGYDVHGITAEQLAGQPTFAAVSDQIAAAVAGRTVVGHHVRFDTSMVNGEWAAAGHRWRITPQQTVCTVKLARFGLPGLSNYKLGTICDAVGIDLRNAHDAGADAEATKDLLLHLRRLVSPSLLPLHATHRRLSRPTPAMGVCRATAERSTVRSDHHRRGA